MSILTDTAKSGNAMPLTGKVGARMTLLPEHAHSLVIERLRCLAAQPQASQVQAWLLRARAVVESQQLYGNFHMRMKTMQQVVGETR